ncbi:MAG: S24 family peptidase [Synechococcaceae cyanobacterium]|nr:S24 family peptidase [Synechococcaceae cyanobacterium]
MAFAEHPLGLRPTPATAAQRRDPLPSGLLIRLRWSAAPGCAALSSPGSTPILSSPAYCRVDLHRLLIPRPERTLLLRVSGESMLGAGIASGDLLVVERTSLPQAGQIVVALLADGFTLKRLARRGDRWWLEAAHPGYPALPLAHRSDRIFGAVRHVIRHL